jgi:hypothetical protein
MKNINLNVSDKVHYTIEKMTNPALVNRQALDIKKKISFNITDKTSEILGMFSRNTGGRPFKDKSLNLYTKAELCELLLSGFNNVWTAKNNDPKWQENEFIELKKICILYANEMKKKTGKNIGMFKITKQMMFSAVLHRLATTQDLKAFFNKTL